MGGAQPSSQREETLVALRAEVARLEEAESLQRAADSALNSLQDKIADLKVNLCLPSGILNASLCTQRL